MSAEAPEPAKETSPGSAWKALRAKAADFDDMPDAEKVEFSLAELDAAADMIEDLLASHDALRTYVEDPDGLIRFTLGSDGRLLELFVHDAIGQQLDHLEFEKLFNGLLEAGNEGVRESLREWEERGFEG